MVHHGSALVQHLLQVGMTKADPTTIRVTLYQLEREIAMSKRAITLCILLLCATSIVFAAEIKPSDVAGTPKVYCKVVKEPNPALLGHFGCVHRRLNEETDAYVMEPIEYWLVKVDDKYAVYFYRVKDGTGKKFRGWRKWYLEGDKINSGEMAYIFVKDGDIHYGWRSDKPTKMTRME